MLRQILCLSHSNPGAASAGLAAAAQAAVHNSNGIIKGLYNRQSEPWVNQTPGLGGVHHSSNDSSALHQQGRCQQRAAATASNEQQHQRKHVEIKTRRDLSRSWQQQCSQTIDTTAAALARCRPHLQQQQQQQRAFSSQATGYIYSSVLQACYQKQQQQQVLQGPAAFWLVGQAWRGLLHPNK
jgi:hypothetical protein